MNKHMFGITLILNKLQSENRHSDVISFFEFVLPKYKDPVRDDSLKEIPYISSMHLALVFQSLLALVRHVRHV